MSLLQDKVNEIATKHAKIIEDECKKVCDKFNCNPEDLIMEYHANTQIKIGVRAAHFEITNIFHCESDFVKVDSFSLMETSE